MTKGLAEGILGLEGRYTQESLRRVHRDLLRECHPDGRPDGGETLAKRINAAYKYLVDLFDVLDAGELECDDPETDIERYRNMVVDLEIQNEELRREVAAKQDVFIPSPIDSTAGDDYWDVPKSTPKKSGGEGKKKAANSGPPKRQVNRSSNSATSAADIFVGIKVFGTVVYYAFLFFLIAGLVTCVRKIM